MQLQPKHNDGGDAFPTLRTTEATDGIKYVHAEPGMRLRDWFAGQALNGLAVLTARSAAVAAVAGDSAAKFDDAVRALVTLRGDAAAKFDSVCALVATNAYSIADAMIFERDRQSRDAQEAERRARIEALASANAVADRAYTDDEYFAKLDDVQQRLKAITQEIRTMQSHCAAGREDSILEAASHAGLAFDCLDEARV